MTDGQEYISSTEARLLAASMSDLKSDVGDMRVALQAMQRSMEALVRIDEQQINMRSSIGRAFDEVREERQKREALDLRVHLLEVDAPSYKELRRWVVGGVLTGVAMLAAALLKVVVLDPVSASYVVRPAITTPQIQPPERSK